MTGENVTTNECNALRLLHADGYTSDELSFMFELGESTVIKHMNAECDHATVATPRNVPTPPTGDELRRERRARGLTLDDLADGLGLSHGAVQRWESENTVPRESNARALNAFLDETDPHPDVLEWLEREDGVHTDEQPANTDEQPAIE